MRAGHVPCDVARPSCIAATRASSPSIRPRHVTPERALTFSPLALALRLPTLMQHPGCTKVRPPLRFPMPTARRSRRASRSRTSTRTGSSTTSTRARARTRTHAPARVCSRRSACRSPRPRPSHDRGALAPTTRSTVCLEGAPALVGCAKSPRATLRVQAFSPFISSGSG